MIPRVRKQKQASEYRLISDIDFIVGKQVDRRVGLSIRLLYKILSKRAILILD